MRTAPTTGGPTRVSSSAILTRYPGPASRPIDRPTPAERFRVFARKSSMTRRWNRSTSVCAVCVMSPAVWTNRSSYSSGEALCTIQYARNPSPVNLSNHPPDRRIPRRTELTNRSITDANSPKRIASFIRAVDSRMSAAITNIWIASPSITESRSSSLRKRVSQSGGACGSRRRSAAARSRSRSDAGASSDAMAPPRACWGGASLARGGHALEGPVQPRLPLVAELLPVRPVLEEVVADHRLALEPVDEPVDRVVGDDAEEVDRQRVDLAIDRWQALGGQRDPFAHGEPVGEPERAPEARHHHVGVGNVRTEQVHGGREPPLEVPEVLGQLEQVHRVA